MSTEETGGTPNNNTLYLKKKKKERSVGRGMRREPLMLYGDCYVLDGSMAAGFRYLSPSILAGVEFSSPTRLPEFVEIESRVSPIELRSADIKVVAPANPTCLRHKRVNRWWPRSRVKSHDPYRTQARNLIDGGGPSFSWLHSARPRSAACESTGAM